MRCKLIIFQNDVITVFNENKCNEYIKKYREWKDNDVTGRESGGERIVDRKKKREREIEWMKRKENEWWIDWRKKWRDE